MLVGGWLIIHNIGLMIIFQLIANWELGNMVIPCTWVCLKMGTSGVYYIKY